MVSLAGVPSHGEKLLGVFYLAAGADRHPTLILMHGFPGFEQNLDLAQAIRRAGWNVLAVHYRGSWGVKGNFSYAHAIEDADAEVAFVRDPANAAKYHIDPNKVVLLGHSMGGFMVASAAAHDPKISGVVMISAWNIGASFPPPEAGEQAIQKAKQSTHRRTSARTTTSLPSPAAPSNRWWMRPTSTAQNGTSTITLPRSLRVRSSCSPRTTDLRQMTMLSLWPCRRRETRT